MFGHDQRLTSPNCRGRADAVPPVSRGFTIVELVIVVLILGILAAVGAPRYLAALDGAHVRAAAARIASDLKYARQLARQSSANQTVSFDVGTNSYSLVGVASRDRRGRSYAVSLSDRCDAELGSVDFDGTTSVVFDIWGHADHAGTIVVQAGSRTKTVAVDGYGLVSIQ